jgi:hypothetical protein
VLLQTMKRFPSADDLIRAQIQGRFNIGAVFLHKFLRNSDPAAESRLRSWVDLLWSSRPPARVEWLTCRRALRQWAASVRHGYTDFLPFERPLRVLELLDHEYMLPLQEAEVLVNSAAAAFSEEASVLEWAYLRLGGEWDEERANLCTFAEVAVDRRLLRLFWSKLSTELPTRELVAVEEVIASQLLPTLPGTRNSLVEALSNADLTHGLHIP